MFDVVILGAPGAGKGTQSKLIAQKYNLKHVSTGDLFRKEIEEKTELGQLADGYISQGKLVPDDIVISMLNNLLDRNETDIGYVFDGFPRTIKQASSFESILGSHKDEIDLVFTLEVEKEILVERMLKRKRLEGRNDDQRDIIQVRFQVYESQTAPLKDYYQKLGKLVRIDGKESVEEIFQSISSEIDKLFNNGRF